MCRDNADDHIQKPNPSSLFLVKSFYSALKSSDGDVHPTSAVWMGLVPPHVDVFCWLVVAGKISTVDILRRKGFYSRDLVDIYALVNKKKQ